MNATLEKVLRAQMKLQGLIEEREELNYELEVLLTDGDSTASNIQGNHLSFDALLEMVVNKLKGLYYNVDAVPFAIRVKVV
ncbi:unnamed protein product [Phytophthora fragariaefolia]|uniref:Unnamed protein product n=1 Tax=Phytophthora fragariaefolia TaxID=1490495 RepID=A0A9W6XK08_9STRA|nr:unnamed protein product [Phytophthora fragariaefolia]